MASYWCNWWRDELRRRSQLREVSLPKSVSMKSMWMDPVSRGTSYQRRVSGRARRLDCCVVSAVTFFRNLVLNSRAATSHRSGSVYLTGRSGCLAFHGDVPYLLLGPRTRRELSSLRPVLPEPKEKCLRACSQVVGLPQWQMLQLVQRQLIEKWQYSPWCWMM